MLIGILSDSHGQHLMVRKAIEVFSDAGVKHLIHCGDVGGPAVFDELIGWPCSFVWGNMDEPEGSLLSYLMTIGIRTPQSVPARLHLGGKAFAVFHGHEPAFQRAVATPDVDYLLHGHTHETRDQRRGDTRIINPGALYRAATKTVAVLDSDRDTLTWHELDE